MANAKAQHLEIDSDIRQTIEAPLPGHMRIPFDQLSGMFRAAGDHVSRELKAAQGPGTPGPLNRAEDDGTQRSASTGHNES